MKKREVMEEKKKEERRKEPWEMALESVPFARIFWNREVPDPALHPEPAPPWAGGVPTFYC